RAAMDGNRKQRPRETQFMTVRISEMKEAFAPFGIAGRGRRLEACRQGFCIDFIDIDNIEHYPPPPEPPPFGRLGDEIEIARHCPKAAGSMQASRKVAPLPGDRSALAGSAGV